MAKSYITNKEKWVGLPTLLTVEILIPNIKARKELIQNNKFTTSEHKSIWGEVSALSRTVYGNVMPEIYTSSGYKSINEFPLKLARHPSLFFLQLSHLSVLRISSNQVASNSLVCSSSQMIGLSKFKSFSAFPVAMAFGWNPFRGKAFDLHFQW